MQTEWRGNAPVGEEADPLGPTPIVRAMVGLVVGALTGAVIALLLPRREPRDRELMSDAGRDLEG